MEQCIALADYNACEADEISFRRGDVITVTAKGSTSGFWEGYVAATPVRGLFPNCLVSSNMRPQQTPTFCDRALCLYDYTAADAAEMSFARGDVLRVVRRSAALGWWYGVNTSRAAEEEPRLLPSNFVTCNIVLAAFEFEARQKHELGLSVGDVIQVHRKWNDGWWEGTLRGRRGIFPSNYTLPNVATTSPPFFCNHCKTVFADNPLCCETCQKEEEIARSMIAALDEYATGKKTQLDLFAYVDIESTDKDEKGSNTADEGLVRRIAGAIG
ncbi:putative intersectin-1-like [Trypanosoma theileri]|uniref:Putative intersectin-1-like n=1 Tax=Trypanosoma theileri TaxID=67003 RepID=A0A1X0P6X6_9TRYP|nr:putative intersectin-1-like [Trypanosoma theileri]ORC92339.1 putative intersectin-1-like [Trypanosoma theileri]